jgi:2'-5' RNA ligase
MRLFTGLSIPPPILQTLCETLDRLRPAAPLNWTLVENLHVTLKFIGEWPEARLPDLQQALASSSKPASFSVEISKFGFFPNPHRPRYFFAGIHAGPELETLARSIDEALANMGCARENRPYWPHLTLARIKNENIVSLREQIAAMSNFQFGSFEATRFHLYLSKPGPAGSAYTLLASYPLSAGEAA